MLSFILGKKLILLFFTLRYFRKGDSNFPWLFASTLTHLRERLSSTLIFASMSVPSSLPLRDGERDTERLRSSPPPLRLSSLRDLSALGDGVRERLSRSFLGLGRSSGERLPRSLGLIGPERRSTD